MGILFKTAVLVVIGLVITQQTVPFLEGRARVGNHASTRMAVQHQAALQ